MAIAAPLAVPEEKAGSIIERAPADDSTASPDYAPATCNDYC